MGVGVVIGGVAVAALSLLTAPTTPPVKDDEEVVERPQPQAQPQPRCRFSDPVRFRLQKGRNPSTSGFLHLIRGGGPEEAHKDEQAAACLVREVLRGVF